MSRPALRIVTIRPDFPLDLVTDHAGWSDHVDDGVPLPHRWTTGHHARLRVRPGLLGSHVRVDLYGLPHTPSADVPHQDVWVFCNGWLTAFGRLDRPGRVSGRVPAPALAAASGELTLDIVTPCAARPAADGDDRPLGLALQAATILSIASAHGGTPG